MGIAEIANILSTPGTQEIQTMPRTTGRPVEKWTPEIKVVTVRRIIDRMLNHRELLSTICMEPDMPSVQTLAEWRAASIEIGEAIAQALEQQTHILVEDAITIVDECELDPENPKLANAEVNKAQARAKARQWLAAKRNRRDYGEQKESPPAPVAPHFHFNISGEAHQGVVGDVIDAKALDKGTRQGPAQGGTGLPGVRLPGLLPAGKDSEQQG